MEAHFLACFNEMIVEVSLNDKGDIIVEQLGHITQSTNNLVLARFDIDFDLDWNMKNLAGGYDTFFYVGEGFDNQKELDDFLAFVLVHDEQLYDDYITRGGCKKLYNLVGDWNPEKYEKDMKAICELAFELLDPSEYEIAVYREH